MGVRNSGSAPCSATDLLILFGQVTSCRLTLQSLPAGSLQMVSYLGNDFLPSLVGPVSFLQF